MVPKRECPVLEPTMASTELEGPEELHIEMQQTALNGFLLTDGTKSSKQEGAFYFQADFGMNTENFTSHRSPGVRKIANEPATARGDCM